MGMKGSLVIRCDFIRINRNPIFLGVMNGSFMFMSDLMKKISNDDEVVMVTLTLMKNGCVVDSDYVRIISF